MGAVLRIYQVLSSVPGTNNAEMTTAWPYPHEIYSREGREEGNFNVPGQGNHGVQRSAGEGGHGERHLAQHCHGSERASRIKPMRTESLTACSTMDSYCLAHTWSVNICGMSNTQAEVSCVRISEETRWRHVRKSSISKAVEAWNRMAPCPMPSCCEDMKWRVGRGRGWDWDGQEPGMEGLLFHAGKALFKLVSSRKHRMFQAHYSPVQRIREQPRWDYHLIPGLKLRASRNEGIKTDTRNV